MLRWSWLWFTTIFCASYVALLAIGESLVHYYPLTGTWSLQTLSQDQGPAIEWYGLTVAAAGIAGLAAVLLPERWLAGATTWVAWLPVLTMLGCLFLLRGYF